MILHLIVVIDTDVVVAGMGAFVPLGVGVLVSVPLGHADFGKLF